MKGLYHGECVALGMLPMCSEGVRNCLKSILESLNLPVRIEGDKEKIIDAIRHDKKMKGDKITIVFVEEIGTYKMKTLDYCELANSLKEALK